ncbi:MAG TPA: hypothetical protein PK637_11795 [Flavobacteriales bacterium]|nr:hypothetical protein [Flavobacteriales bacterium]HRE97443.1 hypothetical protein [Flavobacteriales bacterium]HRJ35742.1 hypothetical protein [Flavobacteriales bacterium]HRJ40048.1 hypothetical protein [Flavobacteriales bacterium]
MSNLPIKPFVFLTSVLFVMPFLAWAQKPASEDIGLVYRKEVVGGGILHSSGVGLHFRYGVQKSYKNKLSFGADFVNMRNPKEVKVSNPNYDDGRGYYYGKLNGVMVLRPFFGERRILFQKLREQGVEVGYNWGIGPSIAMLKPVYLQVIYPTNSPFEMRTVDERYDPSKHNVDNIYGRSRWGLGMDELKMRLGGHARFGLHFEFSPEEDRFKALEVGAAFDLFPAKIPIMANELNKPYFFTLYLNFIFGRKHF